MQDPVLTDIQEGIRLSFTKTLSVGFSPERLGEMMHYSDRSMVDKITNPNECRLPPLDRWVAASQQLTRIGVTTLGAIAFSHGYQHTRPGAAIINGSFDDELCDWTAHYHKARLASEAGLHEKAWQHFEEMQRVMNRFAAELRAAAGAPMRVTPIGEPASGDGAI